MWTTCPRLLRSFAPSRIWTHDLLIACPTLYRLRHCATFVHWIKCFRRIELGFDDSRLSENVGVHGDNTTDRAGGNKPRRHQESPSRQVCVSDRVDDERLHQPETSVWHDESRKQPRLKRLRHRNSARLRLKVQSRLRSLPVTLRTASLFWLLRERRFWGFSPPPKGYRCDTLHRWG